MTKTEIKPSMLSILDKGVTSVLLVLGALVGLILFVTALEGAGVTPSFGMMREGFRYTAYHAVVQLLLGQVIVGSAIFTGYQLWKE